MMGSERSTGERERSIPFRRPDTIQSASLSSAAKAELTEILSEVSLPAEYYCLNFRQDQKHLHTTREVLARVSELVRIARPTAAQMRQIEVHLKDCDLVFAPPGDLAMITRQLLGNNNKFSGEALRRVLNGLIVPPLSVDDRAVEFRSALGAQNLELLKARAPEIGSKILRPRLRKEKALDGALIGAEGITYDRFSDPFAIPRLDSSSEKSNQASPVTFYVCGLKTGVAEQVGDISRVSALISNGIIGIHNSRQAWFKAELNRAIEDTLNTYKNPAIITCRNVILAAVLRNQPIELIGVSHGAGIVSRAIHRAAFVLSEMHWPDDAVERALRQKVSVKTFAGASWLYPDGPAYKHYILKADPVPYYFGLTPAAVPPEENRRLENHFRAQDERFFQGVRWFAGKVMDVIKEPRLHPGRGAELILLGRDLSDAPSIPHSLPAYIERLR